MAKKPTKPAKRTVRRKNLPKNSSVSAQVKQLMQTARSIPGTPFKELERIFNPIAKAVADQAEARRRLHASAQAMYVYMNEQLNLMLAQGYDMDQVTQISNTLQGALTALLEQGMIGLETYTQHLEDALQQMKDLIEVGPRSPR